MVESIDKSMCLRRGEHGEGIMRLRYGDAYECGCKVVNSERRGGGGGRGTRDMKMQWWDCHFLLAGNGLSIEVISVVLYL